MAARSGCLRVIAKLYLAVVSHVSFDLLGRAGRFQIHSPVPNLTEGEEHGLSVFFRLDEEVFHTYSTYGRGTESLTDAYRLLDTTSYGRQQDFEDSPSGWPQKPTYG
jgi:predicted dithiol-disulfide oxidoreductase (DUF899 family)